MSTQGETSDSQKRPILLPKEIKCVLLQGYGSVKQLKTIYIPLPTPGDDEVLVHVKSCGVNFLDLHIRQGQFENLPKLPFVPGFECAGQIVKLGSNISNFKIGDRIICLPRFYAWSEYLVVNCNLAYKMPDNMPFRDAAALSYSYLTAYILLFELGSVKNGQSVLFHSAGGSVGIALTQLCKTVANLRTIGTCSKSKFDKIKPNLDFLFDERAEVDYVQEVKRINPEGVDLVLDCLSGENTNKGISLTKPLGKYVIYGISKNLDGESKNYFALAKNWWHVDKISPITLYNQNRSLSGFNLHNLLFNQSFNTRPFFLNIYAKLFSLYEENKIKPLIDSVYSFEKVHVALGKLQDRENVGKILLEPYLDEEPENVPQSDSAE